MNEKQIAEIEARANVATPGPWEVDLDPRISGADQVVQSETELTICFMAVDESLESDSADTFFIAHAREDIPALINEVRRLRAVLAEYADRDNWDRSCADYPSFDLWRPYEHGYTRAENALKDGE